jgi:hypothetical protein
VGVWHLHVRFVREAGPHRSEEDELLLAELRGSQAKLEANVKTSEALVEAARKTRDTMPAVDPTGNRAKVDQVVAKAEEQHRKSIATLENSRKLLETFDKIDAIREENRTTALRRGILFTLLGLFWSIRAAVSLRAKPKPS